MKYNKTLALIGIIITIILNIVMVVLLVKSFIDDFVGTVCSWLTFGFCFGVGYLWNYIHTNAQYGSLINWSQYSDLRRIRNTIIIIGCFCFLFFFVQMSNVCNFVAGMFTGHFEVGKIEEDEIAAFLYKWSLFLLPYIVFCDYNFVKGNSNALFHVRTLLLIPFIPILYLTIYLVWQILKNPVAFSSFDLWWLARFILIPLILAFFLRLILITYGSNAKKAFPKNERKINTFDLFFSFFIYFIALGLYITDWSSFEEYFYKRTKIEYTKSSDININKTSSSSSIVTFYPKNTTIVDSGESYTFDSYDCPNMNVTDNGSSVKVAWGGTEVILKTTTSNSDTYYCEGETSKGKIAVTAYRSSRSGEIYLVTVQMPNPSPNVNFITINFKP